MPNDAGLNRLQHFQKGIPLKIIGEYADFYKVQLARDDFAWIAKKHVQKADVPDSAKILSYNSVRRGNLLINDIWDSASSSFV